MCSAFYQLLGFIVKKRFFINIDFHMIVIKKRLFGINNDSFSYATFAQGRCYEKVPLKSKSASQTRLSTSQNVNSRYAFFPLSQRNRK